MATEKYYPDYSVCKGCGIPASKLINIPREVFRNFTDPDSKPLITIVCKYEERKLLGILLSEKTTVHIKAGNVTSPDVETIDVSEICPKINWK